MTDLLSEILSLLKNSPKDTTYDVHGKGLMIIKKYRRWFEQFPKDVEKLLKEHAKENVYIKRKKLEEKRDFCKNCNLPHAVNVIEELLQPSTTKTVKVREGQSTDEAHHTIKKLKSSSKDNEGSP